MFKKLQQAVFDVKNRNTKIVNYFARFTRDPGLDRNNSKYYVEMQLLAFQMTHYLKMNDDKNEHAFQGNYNWTFFRENLSNEDFQLLAKKFLGSMNLPQWLEAIEDWSFSESQEYALNVINDKSTLSNADIGDTMVKIIYKPVNSKIEERLVCKKDVAEAMTKINTRVEVEYIKTEFCEYKEELK